MRLIRNVAMAFIYAFAGIRTLMRQRNPRIHFVVATAVLIVGAGLNLSRGAWALLILAIGLVLAMEAFNTSVEALVDLLSPDIRPAAKTAKDVAAGAVLIATIAAAVVGFLILGPPLWRAVFGAA